MAEIGEDVALDEIAVAAEGDDVRGGRRAAQRI